MDLFNINRIKNKILNGRTGIIYIVHDLLSLLLLKYRLLSNNFVLCFLIFFISLLLNNLFTVAFPLRIVTFELFELK